MASLIYDDFRGGLDLRKLQTMGPANALFVLSNAYVTTGKTIKKRPCLNKIATLEAGTAGLRAAGGKLNTFYESGTITHANALFRANKVPHPSLSQAVRAAHFGENFNGYLYAVTEYEDGSIWHHYMDGTNPPQVTDANCPQSSSVRKINQKLYAKDDENVSYCATSAPRDWTTANDAGFIPAGTNAAGSDTVSAVGEYQSGLAIFFSDSMQLWAVDSDPTKNVIKSNANIGTIHSKTPVSLASDLVFLSAMGFRTVTQTSLTLNLQENDLGSPIEKLRNEIAADDDPISIFYPKLGQLWVINGTKAYVYSFSRSAKLAAWSTYTFLITVDAAAVLLNELYLRSGDDIYQVDDLVFTDNGEFVTVDVEMFYQDAKTSGILKQFTAMDGVVKGSPEIAFKFNTNEGTDITQYTPIVGDMRPGDLVPMEVCATSIAPVFTHRADEAFELQALQLYYFPLGNV